MSLMALDQWLKVLTLDQWIKVGQIIAAFAVGGAASYVSYQQLKIAQIKQRLELYERRLVIIKSTEDFISKVINTEFVTQDVVKFSQSISEAKFLFGADIDSYLMKIIEDAFEVAKMNIYMTEERQGIPVAAAPVSPARKAGVLKMNLFDDLKNLREKFSKYMNLYN